MAAPLIPMETGTIDGTRFIIHAEVYDRCVAEIPGFENNPHYVREQHTRPLSTRGFLVSGLMPTIKVVKLWLLPDGLPPGVERRRLKWRKQ